MTQHELDTLTELSSRQRIADHEASGLSIHDWCDRHGGTELQSPAGGVISSASAQLATFESELTVPREQVRRRGWEWDGGDQVGACRSAWRWSNRSSSPGAAVGSWIGRFAHGLPGHRTHLVGARPMFGRHSRSTPSLPPVSTRPSSETARASTASG